MSQRFFTISKKVERLLMNGIRTGQLDNFAVSGRNHNSLEFKMRQVLKIKNLKNSLIFRLFFIVTPSIESSEQASSIT